MIKKIYRNTISGDESYIQTIAFHSEFKEKIYQFRENVSKMEASLRYVDWTRKGLTAGSPYNLTIDDYDELVNSKCLFARKIDGQSVKGSLLLERLEQL